MNVNKFSQKSILYIQHLVFNWFPNDLTTFMTLMGLTHKGHGYQRNMPSEEW